MFFAVTIELMKEGKVSTKLLVPIYCAINLQSVNLKILRIYLRIFEPHFIYEKS